MLNFHFLQYTLFFFIPAILLCIKLKRWIGFFILVSNFVCSFIVHRIDRKEESELCDYCDNYAIYLWIFYNIYLVVKITSNLKTNKNIIILCFIILSLCSSIIPLTINSHILGLLFRVSYPTKISGIFIFVSNTHVLLLFT